MKSLRIVIATIMSLLLVAMCVPSVAIAAETDEEDVAIIVVGGQKIPYQTLASAMADSITLKLPAYLVSNYEFKDGDTIPENATLIIPTSDSYDDTAEGHNDKGTPNNQGAFITASVPSGVNLVVNGTLIVAGNQQGGIGKTGFLNGKYGAIKLDGTMEVNGTLYARGEVTGNGSVTVNDGGTVYQRFEISDWRGGNASLNAYTFYSVYPFNLYEANGLNVTATYHYGAKMMGQSYIYSDRRGTGVLTDVEMFGDNGLITPSAGAEVTFKHDPITEVSTAYVTGTVATGNITIYVDTVLGIEIPITSSHGVGPFGYKQDVVLNDGAVFNVTNPLQVLPGCTITVSSGAKMNIENGMYFFTSSGYDSAWNNIGWPSGIADIGDAKLVVDSSVENPGTVVGTIGSSSDTFVNIFGLGSLSSTTSVGVSEVTQTGSDVTRVSATFFTVTLPTPAE